MPLRSTAIPVSVVSLPKAKAVASGTRELRLDALRGLFLVIMAAVHVPTPLSRLFQEPFGFVSAAEGFVFLGACLAGFVYGKTYVRDGWTAMSQRVWKRLTQIYQVHLGLLLPIALLAWVIGQHCIPLSNHFHDFLLHPWSSLGLIFLLLHQPPLFDILPLYVVLLAATPGILECARKYGWGKILAGSALLWLIAQLRITDSWLGDPATLLPLRLGSFSLLAWQFLWVCGLALGETALRGAPLHSKQRVKAGTMAGVIVIAGFLVRHGLWPQGWHLEVLYNWIDKWTLGPLRVLNFASGVVLLLAWRPPLPALFSPLAVLGRHSLAVFSFHVPLAIAATILIETFGLSLAEQTTVGLVVIALMFAWAAWLEKRRLSVAVAKESEWKPVGVQASLIRIPLSEYVSPCFRVSVRRSIRSPGRPKLKLFQEPLWYLSSGKPNHVRGRRAPTLGETVRFPEQLFLYQPGRGSPVEEIRSPRIPEIRKKAEVRRPISGLFQ
jgi:hypothetical protein